MSALPNVGDTLTFWEDLGEGYSGVTRARVVKVHSVTGKALVEFKDESRLWAQWQKRPLETWDSEAQKTVKLNWKLLKRD